MNSLDRQFKDLLCDELDRLHKDATNSLAIPVTPAIASDLHEIGLLRGYMKALVEIYDTCDYIQNKLTEPEKKNESASS